MNYSTFDNKNSSGGLSKQKYFCQICNRQCRDKDGFNCHLKSNTHRINMEIVSKNPEQFINQYSFEFEKGFLDILKRNYSGIFISANKVYQEYISDRFATHLNATKWTSLTGFLKSLEDRGKCELKADEKEVLIRYNDLSPSEKFLNEKKIKEAEIEEKKRTKDLEKIIQKANEKNIIKSDEQLNERNNIEPEKLKNISIEFKINSENKKDFLNKKREKEKDQMPCETVDLVNDPWMVKSLIVRIKDKELPYYNKKGKITNVLDSFLAEVEVLNEKEPIKLKIDQAYLEPVIPQSGKIKIIFGRYKGLVGTIVKIYTDKIVEVLVEGKHSNNKLDIKTICKYE